MTVPGGDRVQESIDLTTTEAPGPRGEGTDVTARISGSGKVSVLGGKGVEVGVQFDDHAGDTASAMKYLVLSFSATLPAFAWLAICVAVGATALVTLPLCGALLLGGWIATLTIYLRESRRPGPGPSTDPPGSEPPGNH
jgi:hypothetical protein